MVNNAVADEPALEVLRNGAVLVHRLHAVVQLNIDCSKGFSVASGHLVNIGVCPQIRRLLLVEATMRILLQSTLQMQRSIISLSFILPWKIYDAKLSIMSYSLRLYVH